MRPLQQICIINQRWTARTAKVKPRFIPHMIIIFNHCKQRRCLTVQALQTQTRWKVAKSSTRRTCAYARSCSHWHFLKYKDSHLDSPQEDIGPSRHLAPPADAQRKANATQSPMEYARPSEPGYQQRIDYKIPFGDTSVPVQCPACQQRTVSKTNNVSGGYT